MSTPKWRTVNPSGSKRVLVSKELPGQRWLDILTAADCRVDISTSTDVLSIADIKTALRTRCDGEPLGN